MVLEIRGNSLDDGPGIRTVVFFKGCPLDCAWCHNPESKSPEPELSFDRGRCVDCGSCLAACRKGALERNRERFVDRAACDHCFACVDACPGSALERVGRSLNIDAICAAVERDIPFFAVSGGGVTLSGGEPAMHPAFVGSLLQRLKARGISTIIETCGHFNGDAFERLILPHLDMVYFDLKIMDRDCHREYCGVDNDLILDNFARLARSAKNGGPPILPRTPLVPGVTDTEENLCAIARFIAEQGITEARLLPYNPLWRDKIERISDTPRPWVRTAWSHWMKGDDIRRCEQVLTANHIAL